MFRESQTISNRSERELKWRLFAEELASFMRLTNPGAREVYPTGNFIAGLDELVPRETPPRSPRGG